jgi:hypothetical protein
MCTKSGTEKAYHVVHCLYDIIHDLKLSQDTNSLIGDSWINMCTILKDYKSAYQDISRRAMMDGYLRFPETAPLWRIAHCQLSRGAKRFVTMADSSVRMIRQECGGPQGSVIMPLGFVLALMVQQCNSLSIPQVISMNGEIQFDPQDNRPHKSKLVVASFLDDTATVGLFDTAIGELEYTVDKSPECTGLELNMQKTVCLAPSGALDDIATGICDSMNLKISSEGKYMGGFIGSDEYISTSLAEKINPEAPQYNRLAAGLTHPHMNPQFATLLLRHTITSPMYYVRLHDPKLSRDALRVWDKRWCEIFYKIMGFSEFGDSGIVQPRFHDELRFKRELLQLPVCYGGFGLIPMEHISDAAFLGSLAASAGAILDSFEQFFVGISLDNFYNPDVLPPKFEDAYSAARDTLIRLVPKIESLSHNVDSDQNGPTLVFLPTTLINFLRQYQQYPNLSHQLQKKLTKQIWEESFKRLLETASPIDRSRMMSNSQPGAGRVLNIIPSDRSLEMLSYHYRLAGRHRAGLLPLSNFYARNQCKLLCPMCRLVDLYEVPQHYNHCTIVRRTQRNDTHDGVGGKLQSAAKASGVPTLWTPGLSDSHKATDLGMQFPTGKFIQADVSVVSHDAPSNVGGSAMKAALSQWQIKKKEYDKHVRDDGDKFLPLIFETSGAWLKEFPILTKRIHAAGFDNKAYNPWSTQLIRDVIAVEIQVGNAMCQIELINRSLSSGSQAKALARNRRWKQPHPSRD